MKQFSKKLDLSLVIASLVIALAGSVIIAMSGNLLYMMQKFFETRVFHRTFKIEKWADTINALLTFPIFIAIFFDAIFFVKFSSKSKIILLSFYAAITIFFIAFCSAVKSDEFMDSDMASEILLAKECWLNKTFWLRSWHYSTEFRLLNTQIIAAPIFAFTSDWHVVKIVSAVIISLILPLSMWFLLNQLKISSIWIKVISCLLILCPWSSIAWKNMQFGNYYIPHVAMSFFYVGLCLSLIFNQNPAKKQKAFKILFYALSVICGLSSIRYILQFQFPLTAVVISIATNNLVKEKKEFNAKKFLIDDKKVFYPAIGLVLGGIGYIFNSFVLSHYYSFANFNIMKFNGFNEIPIMRWIFDILTNFGYRERVSVFTPSGIINILVYIFVVFFILCTISFLRKKTMNEMHYVFVLYAITMFVFNAFVFINTDYYARYILILTFCIFPVLAIFADSNELPIIRQTILSLVASIALFTSSFVVYSTVLSTNWNEEKLEIAKVLQNEGYSFGYASFWNANILSFVTNGKLEVGTIDYKHYPWLTPKKYYKEDYKPCEKVFLLLTTEEIEKFHEVLDCEKAEKIYENKFYTVFNFESNKLFRSEWGKDHLYRLSLKNDMP